MKKSIAAALIASMLILLVTPAMPVAAAFSHGSTDITGYMTKYVGLNGKYRPISQGMCIADHYLVVTRTSSNSQPTTYVVIDLKTKKEVGHYDFKTGHSNSLTYNPDKGELVCVSDGRAYLFDFNDGVITSKGTVSLGYHCVKVAYVQSEGCYYTSTGIRMFKTKDFKSMSLVFSAGEHGINQGMGSDGQNLYIVWYRSSGNTLQVLSTKGKSITTYTCGSGTCREFEEVDFYKGNMYVNVIGSGSNNGIYVVKGSDGAEVAHLEEGLKTPEGTEQKDTADSKTEEKQAEKTEVKQAAPEPEPEPEPEPVHVHEFPDKWTVIEEATCTEEGLKQVKCNGCDEVKKKKIPATGKHEAGDWEVTIEPTCDTVGLKRKHCTVCKCVLEEGDVPALGHTFANWKETKSATVYDPQEFMRQCGRCNFIETKKGETAEPFIHLNKTSVTTAWYKDAFKLTAELEAGDKIVSFASDNPNVASVSNKGTVTPHFPGEATITVKTETGLKATCKVKIQLYLKK